MAQIYVIQDCDTNGNNRLVCRLCENISDFISWRNSWAGEEQVSYSENSGGGYPFEYNPQGKRMFFIHFTYTNNKGKVHKKTYFAELRTLH